MRLAPIAVYNWRNIQTARHHAELQSKLTHGHPVAVDAAKVLAHMIVLAITGASKEDVLSATGFPGFTTLPNGEENKVAALFQPNAQWRTKNRNQLIPTPHGGIGSASYALEVTLWCLSKTNNYRDAILMVSNLGEDADTTAAILGSVAGALYGVNSIPIEWRNTLVLSQEIHQMAENLFDPDNTEMAVVDPGTIIRSDD